MNSLRYLRKCDPFQMLVHHLGYPTGHAVSLKIAFEIFINSLHEVHAYQICQLVLYWPAAAFSSILGFIPVTIHAYF